MKVRMLKKADILLAAVVLIAAFFAVFVYISTRDDGAYAVVSVDGEEVARYLLSDEVEEDIATEYGTNHISIKGGVCRVTDADCPDLICVNAYRAGISHDGETIICLPHKLVVIVEGGKEAPVDAVAEAKRSGI